MESLTSVSRSSNQTSKKRVFSGGSSSSSSAPCEDLEVLEMAPPSNFTSAKPRSSKDEEDLSREIIDVEDMEEDDMADGVPKTSAKGKEIMQDSSADIGSLTNDEYLDDIMSNTGGSRYSLNADDFNSSPFDGEDEWAESYHDEMLYDDYSVWESQFDHMDIPTGVEMPFPWFPGAPTNDTKTPEMTSLTPPSVEPQPNADNLTPVLDTNQSFLLSQLKDAVQEKVTSLSGTSKALLALKTAKQSSHSFGRSKRDYRSVNSFYANHLNHSPSGAVSTNAGVGGDVSDGDGGFSPWDSPTAASGANIYMLFGMSGSSTGFSSDGGFQSATDHVGNRICASPEGASVPTSTEPRNIDEIMQNYGSFKRFDTVEDFSDHHYHKGGYPPMDQPPKKWAKKIQEEWRILEKDLPDTIFVRAYEARMDLLRAVIIGAEGTPYHDGLFFFDIYFPSEYPDIPPSVYYHSGGLRINPNLYNCGKVCLSLLNTWSGSEKEKWIPGESTMLQVLVSIQGLILNAKPFFNEPGYGDMSGSVPGEKRSREYNETTFIYSLQTMVYKMRSPPKHFEDFVVGHFCKFARDILVSCKAYLDGAQVGCLVKGGVQDVDEGDKSCSRRFKASLSGFLSILVNTFLQIGAKDCEEFADLAAQSGNGIASAPPPRRVSIHLHNNK